MTQTPNFKKPAILFFLPIIFCALYFSGCAIFSDDLSKMTPAQLLQEGKRLFKKKDYHKAEEVYRKFAEDFPNSNMMDSAIMGQADSIYYQGDRYLEADFQYLNFIELYPVHPNVSKAYFFKAMCSFKQMEAYNRDQTNTLDAMKNFLIVVNEYPNTRYSKKAKKYVKECKNHLAENLFHIGKYYYKVRAHQSTIFRMNELIKTYPNFKSNDEAFFLIGESYYNEENYLKAAEIFTLFLKKYRKSQFRSEARKRLKSIKSLGL